MQPGTSQPGTSQPRTRHLSGLYLVLLLVATSILPAQEQDDAPIFVERVDVNVINVEVFVTDKSGHHVVGLTRDDFELYENGEQVEISNFYAAARGDRLMRDLEEGRAVMATDTPLVVPAAEPLPPEQQLHLLVYVDHHNLHKSNQKRVLDSLDGFLEDRIIQGDRIMLVGYDNSLKVVEPFTRDRRRVAAGLDRLRRATTHRQIDDNERRRVMRLMTTATAEIPPDIESAYQHVRSYVQATRSDLRRTVDSLGRVVRILAGLPGRKAVLYVSDGLPMRPGEELYQHLLNLFGQAALRSVDVGVGLFDPVLESVSEDQSHLFSAVTREANAHQVTLYTLDARGTFGDSTLSAGFADITSGPGGPTSFDTIRTQNLQEPLIEIAEATGGTATINSFSFDNTFKILAQDYDSYYSLGYSRPGGGDDKYHKIEVRLKNPKLRVRHRSGFMDKPQAERVADRTLSSLLLDLGKNPLGVNVEFGAPEEEGRDKYVLPVLVRIPIGEITLLPDGGNHQGRLRFYIVVKDTEGGISDMHDMPYPIEIPTSGLQGARTQELGYGVKLRVRGGVPTVAVGVWDELSGVESFVHKQVRVGEEKRKKQKG